MRLKLVVSIFVLVSSAIGLAVFRRIKVHEVHLKELALPASLPPKYILGDLETLTVSAIKKWPLRNTPKYRIEQKFNKSEHDNGFVRYFYFDTIQQASESFRSLIESNRKSFKLMPHNIQDSWQLQETEDLELGTKSWMLNGVYPFAQANKRGGADEFGMAELLFVKCQSLAWIQIKVAQERSLTTSNRASDATAKLSKEYAIKIATQLNQKLSAEQCKLN